MCSGSRGLRGKALQTKDPKRKCSLRPFILLRKTHEIYRQRYTLKKMKHAIKIAFSLMYFKAYVCVSVLVSMCSLLKYTCMCTV